jgi:hypothetical protein
MSHLKDILFTACTDHLKQIAAVTGAMVAPGIISPSGKTAGGLSQRLDEVFVRMCHSFFFLTGSAYDLLHGFQFGYAHAGRSLRSQH